MYTRMDIGTALKLKTGKGDILLDMILFLFKENSDLEKLISECKDKNNLHTFSYINKFRLKKMKAAFDNFDNFKSAYMQDPVYALQRLCAEAVTKDQWSKLQNLKLEPEVIFEIHSKTKGGRIEQVIDASTQ